MPRSIPYVFCRYRITVEEQRLDSAGQKQFLNECQGTFFPHGWRRRNRPQSQALIMQPTDLDHEKEICLIWLVGIQSGYRMQINYNRSAMELIQQLVQDRHINFAPVLALPARGLMAIEDRSAEGRISAKQAIAAFRSVVHTAHDSMGSLQVWHGDPADTQRWLSEWELLEYTYTISPLNPISASELAERRSEAMKRENIGRDSGRVQPPDGQSMRPSEGIIEETSLLQNS